MRNRWISVFLCVVMLLGMALPVFAQDTQEQEIPEADETIMTTVQISSEAEFLEFAENCRLDSYSLGLVVSLEADIDLSGASFEGIPLFSGIFLGNDHTVSGLNIAADGSAQGLFRYLTATAVVSGLTVEGTIQPGGSSNMIGGIAGSNAGTILNCSFSGTVSGSSNVGGIAGINSAMGIIDSCHVDGEINGSHFIGGVVGENNGVIRNCSNRALINTEAQQNSVEISDITLDTLTNSEAANTVTDIGGIAGLSSGVIRNCTNLADVGYQHMGYNIGGIAGTQSGYIRDCRNYADIRGRKEVGGIVGQMEPVSLIEFTQDTLQILQEQLGIMSELVNTASGNAQANAGQIGAQIGVLRSQAQTARDALESLLSGGSSDEETPDRPETETPEQPETEAPEQPDEDAPEQPGTDIPQLPDIELPDIELPDTDSILAAQNALSSALGAMPGTLNSIAAAAQTTVNGLSRDMQAISEQISIMGQTINDASENLGGAITDVSDLDTAETLTGKVEGCTNHGNVLADLNAGGITGAIAVENDLDILEDWEQYGEESLNFESEVRAVILNCDNLGTVIGKKQNAGGIVGWQSLGLVKGCVNTGKLDAADANYVGGICGLSRGFVRSNHAKCEISGSTYVGGIAGSAAIVTDCRSMVILSGGSEKLGAILGNAEQTDTQEEAPIGGNLYFPVKEDIGAIDGISYSGAAQSLRLDEFMSLGDLPTEFRSVTVSFLFEDGTQKRISVAPGGEVTAAQIPELPEKDGYTGKWEGLETGELTDLVFDLTFEAVYTAHSAVIQSEEVRENGLPVLLVQGDFAKGASVTVSRSDASPELSEGETLVECWGVQIAESTSVTAARLQVPEREAEGEWKLLACGEDGLWKALEHTVDGSYLVFSWNQDNTRIALIQAETFHWFWPAAGAVVICLLAVLLFSRRRKMKTGKNAAEDHSSTQE